MPTSSANSVHLCIIKSSIPQANQYISFPSSFTPCQIVFAVPMQDLPTFFPGLITCCQLCLFRKHPLCLLPSKCLPPLNTSIALLTCLSVFVASVILTAGFPSLASLLWSILPPWIINLVWTCFPAPFIQNCC